MFEYKGKAIVSLRKKVFPLLCCFLASVSIFSATGFTQAETELGSEGDLTILGTGGTAVDPNVEIKGFTVFGSTQTSYDGAVISSGSVVINGYLSVSSGAYFAAPSTFAANSYFIGGATFTTGGAYFTGVSSFAAGPGGIYINGGNANQVLKKVSGGAMAWDDISAMVSGDNLGNHVATTT
jgi:hypothetical protein